MATAAIAHEPVSNDPTICPFHRMSWDTVCNIHGVLPLDRVCGLPTHRDKATRHSGEGKEALLRYGPSDVCINACPYIIEYEDTIILNTH